MKVNKIVLAYSGGLDTSVIIKWLKEKYDAEIIAFAADVGQGQELDPVRGKAFATGASETSLPPAFTKPRLSNARGLP